MHGNAVFISLPAFAFVCINNFVVLMKVTHLTCHHWFEKAYIVCVRSGNSQIRVASEG